MTTHPPGHPTGPTGPGRIDTPGPSDAAVTPPVGPGANLPRLGEVIRDAERLIAQAEAVLRRDVDPASEPTVMAWPALAEDVLVHNLLLGEVIAQLHLVQRKLGRIVALPLPPVGSAVEVSFVGPSAMDPAAFAKQVAAAIRRNAEGRP